MNSKGWKRRLKREASPNSGIQRCLLFLTVCYLFFFTSNWWLPNNMNDEKQTPLNESVMVADHSYTVTRWTYSETESRMQVEIDLYNQAFDGINTYEYSCITRNGRNVTVQAAVETPTMLVLLLNDIPANYGAVSLRVTPEGLGMEARIRLYTNEQDVEQVEAISVFDTAEAYLQNRLEREIERLQQEREELSAQIETLQTKIEECEWLSEQMRENLSELSVSDAADLEERIKENEQKATDYSNQLTGLQESLFDLDYEIQVNKNQLYSYAADEPGDESEEEAREETGEETDWTETDGMKTNGEKEGEGS